MKDNMKQLSLVSSVVAWTITAAIAIWAFSDEEEQVNFLASEYAFNVVEQGLAGKSDPKLQVEQVANWKKNGWSAQTGAIKTLCNINKERMELFMDEKVVKDVCRLIRTPEPLDVLTPIK
ncbi:hypothetical protein AB4259_22620 [Vibrio amylolyticus]|uniref:hypothetical protein n=1 Tax=Vibrio amylolyticus TaxID=2847292 RepID=UPI00354FE628